MNETQNSEVRTQNVASELARLNDELITEEWLREVGFKWHEFECSGGRHWLVWLGDAMGEHDHDIGIEVAPPIGDGGWFCWFRADYDWRYMRFIHLRHVRYRWELVRIIEGLTFQPWDPANHMCGCVLTPERAQRRRASEQRPDIQMLRGRPTWRETENDTSRAKPLPEDLEEAEKYRRFASSAPSAGEGSGA